MKSKLMGIVTSRDIQFLKDRSIKIREVQERKGMEKGSLHTFE
jgi:hypothetical protein